ncbi:MAG: M61 family metallopeptidase [Parabacteroides sp.]
MRTKLFLLCWFLMGMTAFSRMYAAARLEYELRFDPAAHYIEVTLQASDLSGHETLFKMPVWAPGYYLILDYPKHVTDFQVTASDGTPLPWTKEGKNGWRITQGDRQQVTIRYRVFADNQSVAEAKVTPERAFVPGNGVYLYVDQEKESPVTVTFLPPAEWKEIITGLEPVPQKKGSFRAADFDTLYDCPVLIGNPKVVHFDVEGRSYELAMETPDGYRETSFVQDLQTMIRTTTRLMGGEVPYQHYHFLLLGAGGGGLEHLNSQACFTSGSFRFEDRAAYLRFLSFITHEYFHLYNVKAIRPIELGPFDYDREVFTPGLWFSEGITCYYENRILYEAGLLSPTAFLKEFSDGIRTVESREGHRHMSLRTSSYDIWLHFFNRNANAHDVTISYYDKGPILGLLMDIEIRRLTAGKKNIDDLMCYLYRQYYRQEKRGFTEEEFWQACTTVAGQPLEEIRRYVDTTAEIDYAKYLGYAGLEMDGNYQIHFQADGHRAPVQLFGRP